MAIMKATYTRRAASAKAAIRYIAHRRGKAGERMNRILFTSDGAVGRYHAYRMIAEAAQGSYFYRIVLSPDPQREDTRKDLLLRDVTEKTILSLEARLQTRLAWIAAEHNDHSPHRHIHIIAVVPEKLNVQDFQALRHTATAACLAQRNERDLLREQSREQEEGRTWER